jgi:hypothetical protein
MKGYHGSFSYLTSPLGPVVEAMASFEGAVGFRRVSWDGSHMRLERHAWFRDVVDIDIRANDGEEMPDHLTLIVLEMSLNRFRHPFSFGGFCMDLSLLGHAVDDHLTRHIAR